MANTDLSLFPFPRIQPSTHGYAPSPLFAELRKTTPITRVSLFDGTPCWLITSHVLCKEALESPHLSADRRINGYPEIHAGGAKAKEGRPTFVNLDEPDHSSQRNTVEHFFTPEAIESLRPSMESTIERLVDELVQKKESSTDGVVDLVENFALLIPIEIVFGALGIPAKDISSLNRESEVKASTSRNAAEQNNEKLQTYIRKIIQVKLESPSEDIVSTLALKIKDGTLQEEDVVNLVFTMMVAGNAAIMNVVCLGVISLLAVPHQLDEVKNNPTLLKGAVEEILRFHTVSGLNSRRVARKDVEVGGQTIKTGEGVICAVQSASRDDQVYPEPDNFDIHRKQSARDNFGFGHGIHRCQAETLSRVQLETVFSVLFRKIPNLRLNVLVNDLKLSSAEQNIGVKELPVTW